MIRSLFIHQYYDWKIGMWHYETVIPGWYFWASRHFMEMNHLFIPRKFKKVWTDCDRDMVLFADYRIAPFMKAWYWWTQYRWYFYHLLCGYGILYGPNGCYVRDLKLNLDWRWYDKSTWYPYLPAKHE
jgi:hypothetical protein